MKTKIKIMLSAMITLQNLLAIFLFQMKAQVCHGTYVTSNEQGQNQIEIVPHPAQNRILASTNKSFFSSMVNSSPISTENILNYDTKGSPAIRNYARLNSMSNRRQGEEDEADIPSASNGKSDPSTDNSNNNNANNNAPTAPKEEDRLWNRIAETPDPKYNLGIPENRKAACSTIYKVLMNTDNTDDNSPSADLPIDDEDNDKEKIIPSDNEDHDEDSSEEHPAKEMHVIDDDKSNNLEYQEWMIVSGGFTDREWKSFPVWAVNLTNGNGVWVPLQVTSQTNKEISKDPSKGPYGRVGHLSAVYGNYLYIFGGLTFHGQQYYIDEKLIMWRAKIDHLTKEKHIKNEDETPYTQPSNLDPHLDWEVIEPNVISQMDFLLRGEAQGGVYYKSAVDDEGKEYKKPVWVLHGGLTTRSYVPKHLSRSSTYEMPLADVWSYDFETNELELLDAGCDAEFYLECPNSPLARTAHAGTILGDELVIYGGMTVTFLYNTDYFRGEGQKWEMLADVWSLNLITNKWKRWEITPILFRSYHSLVGWEGMSVDDEEHSDSADMKEDKRETEKDEKDKDAYLEDETLGRVRGSIIAYGGYMTYETVTGEAQIYAFSDTLIAHPPLEESDSLSTQMLSFWYKALSPPGYPDAAHRLEHTSVMDSAGALYIWGGRLENVAQISGLWRLNIFGALAKVQFKLALRDELYSEAQLEALQLLVAVMLFMSVLFTALYGTLRRHPEEGRSSGSRTNILGRRRGVAQEIIDAIPVKKWVKPTSSSSQADINARNNQVGSGEKVEDSHTASDEQNAQEEEPECCPICLLEYQEGDEVRTMSCNHEFHKDCVDYWLENNTSCPACRHSIYEGPPTDATASSDENNTINNISNNFNPSMSEPGAFSLNFVPRFHAPRAGYLNQMGLGRRRIHTNRRWLGALRRDVSGHTRFTDPSVNSDTDERLAYVSTLELSEETEMDREITEESHQRNCENRPTLSLEHRSRRMRNPNRSLHSSRGRRGMRRVGQARGETELTNLNLPLRVDSEII